jgi:nuclear GTP-binding protein
MGKDSHPVFTVSLFSKILALFLDRIQMESDDLKLIIPCKRSRSPSEVLTPAPNSNEPRFVRQPKRQRKSKDVPAYNAAPDEHILKRMDRSNPLSRKILKREAKKVRKAGMQRTKRDMSALGKAAEMDVDADDQGLQFTFMA